MIPVWRQLHQAFAFELHEAGRIHRRWVRDSASHFRQMDLSLGWSEFKLMVWI
ncbi:MAG TPA: hypothetical protein V6D18_13570 [Thermosynechococcaceae cyanobacterium]